MLHIILVGAVSASAQSVAKRTTAQSYERLGTVTPVKTTTVNAEPALQLRLTRKYAFSPAYVQSIVRVSPHPDNRLLRITLDSPNFYRSSDIELEGADAARSHFFSWKSLPAGRYDIVVTIFGPEGPRGQSSEVLEVIGGPIIPQ
ncbi:MAG: hypothetical protein ACRD2A_17325 [Vicinamibacterales bacterium]